MRIGGTIAFTFPGSLLGYQELIGLNGGLLANLGLVDYAGFGCAEAAGASLSATISTGLFAGDVPTLGTVYLVRTAAGAFAKLRLDDVDFTEPNGLGFAYQALQCGPDTPEELVAEMIELAAGLEPGSLLTRLELVQGHLAAGRTQPAIALLRALADEVRRLLEQGRIPESVGQEIAGLADAALASLGA